MINKQMHLIDNLFNGAELEFAPTRDGYGKGLVEAGEKDERVVVLCADLAESTRSHWFQEKFPERYIELGVAEQNMATVASGLANYGKIPFISSYAAFSPGRNNEQIRTTAALNNVPVKIGGAHAGISVGPDGATHQALEDAALMRIIPNMTVFVPCDSIEAKKATLAAASLPGPVYIRFAREKSPVFTTNETPFEVGKAQIFRDGKDVAIIGAGMLVYNALEAAETLAKDGIDAMVINSPSLKPFDIETIAEAAKKTGAIVSVEEHQVAGGLGSVIAETLAKNYPVPQEFIGAQDRFGESGNTEELLKEFKMDTPSIIEAAKKVMQRKK